MSDICVAIQVTKKLWRNDKIRDICNIQLRFNVVDVSIMLFQSLHFCCDVWVVSRGGGMLCVEIIHFMVCLLVLWL